MREENRNPSRCCPLPLFRRWPAGALVVAVAAGPSALRAQVTVPAGPRTGGAAAVVPVAPVVPVRPVPSGAVGEDPGPVAAPAVPPPGAVTGPAPPPRTALPVLPAPTLTPSPTVPVPVPLPVPAEEVGTPRVITGAQPSTTAGAPAPPAGAGGGSASRPDGMFVNLRRDTTGMLPDHPPGPPPPRPAGEVAGQVDGLFQRVQDPEAELSVAVGQTKLLETRRPLTRIAVANPLVADVELLNDQADARSLNLYGRSFGDTTITFWDSDERPVSFIVRVTLDAPDLERRIKQAFPGAMVHVRQVGPQVILEGQVPDSKTNAEVLQLVTAELRNSGGIRAQAAGGAGGAGGGAQGGGGGGAGGAMGGSPSGAAGGGVPYYVINRIHVPGPRQVMLHVKIAELNRTAIRQLGISWLDTRNQALLASTIGGAATITGTAGAPAVISQTAASNARGQLSRIASTFGSGASAVNTNSQLFGIFNAGEFSLFLNALRSNALAKILAEPNLVALDGQPARFLSGGLFPYPVPQSSSIPGGTAVVTVQFANFGAILSFLPHILQNDEIQLDVEPVFSALNFGAGTTINGGQVPAIDQRSARTVVRLREGQTLAIAGLLQTTTNAATVRIPALGDLPIVGPWFSRNQIETIETELVVLVTPELISPMEPQDVPPAPGDRVFQPNDYEFYFLGRIEGKLGREFRATVREHDPLSVMKHIASENRWVVGPHGYAD